MLGDSISWFGIGTITRRLVIGGLAALALGVTLGPETARAQTVTNGNFSTVPSGNGTSSYHVTQPSTGVANPNTTGNLSNWNVGGTTGYGCLINSSAFSFAQNCSHTIVGTVGASPDGGNFFAEDTSGNNLSISQTIAGLIIGKQYMVTFYQGAVGEHTTTVSTNINWLVTLDGAAQQTSTTMVIPTSGAFTGWTAQSMIFTVTSASQVLSFLTAESPSGQPPLALLDGIKISLVPEPASLALLGFGMAGIAALRRRRRPALSAA